MNEKKILIFDFDGVILDSVNIKTLAFQEIFKRYSRSIIKKITHHHQVHGGISRTNKIKYYYKYFIKKKLTKKNEAEITNRFKLIISKKILKCKFIPGSYSFLKNNNYTSYISSGTPQIELKKICKKRGIAKYFKNIYGSPSMKENHIRKIIKKHKKEEKKNFIFLGDSLTDKIAAKRCNITFIQVGNLIKKNRRAKNIIPNLKNLNNILNKFND